MVFELIFVTAWKASIIYPPTRALCRFGITTSSCTGNTGISFDVALAMVYSNIELSSSCNVPQSAREAAYSRSGCRKIKSYRYCLAWLRDFVGQIGLPKRLPLPLPLRVINNCTIVINIPILLCCWDRASSWTDTIGIEYGVDNNQSLLSQPTTNQRPVILTPLPGYWFKPLFDKTQSVLNAVGGPKNPLSAWVHLCNPVNICE